MSLDFLAGVFSGIALCVFGLVGIEMFDQYKERKNRKKDMWQ